MVCVGSCLHSNYQFSECPSRQKLKQARHFLPDLLMRKAKPIESTFCIVLALSRRTKWTGQSPTPQQARAHAPWLWLVCVSAASRTSINTASIQRCRSPPISSCQRIACLRPAFRSQTCRTHDRPGCRMRGCALADMSPPGINYGTAKVKI